MLGAWPKSSTTCRQVGLDLQNVPADAQVIDATGKLVMPGEWVDYFYYWRCNYCQVSNCT